MTEGFPDKTLASVKSGPQNSLGPLNHHPSSMECWAGVGLGSSGDAKALPHSRAFLEQIKRQMSTAKLNKRSRPKEGQERKVMLKAVSAHSLPKPPARLFIESPARDGRSELPFFTISKCPCHSKAPSTAIDLSWGR